MKIKMVMQMSGPRPDGSDWPGYGGPLDVSDAEGADLIAAGVAVPVAEERAVESAAMVPDPKVEVRVSAGEVTAPAAVVAATAEPPDQGDDNLPVELRKRGPGRPPGSTNKPRAAQ